MVSKSKSISNKKCLTFFLSCGQSPQRWTRSDQIKHVSHFTSKALNRWSALIYAWIQPLVGQVSGVISSPGVDHINRDDTKTRCSRNKINTRDRLLRWRRRWWYIARVAKERNKNGCNVAAGKTLPEGRDLHRWVYCDGVDFRSWQRCFEIDVWWLWIFCNVTEITLLNWRALTVTSNFPHSHSFNNAYHTGLISTEACSRNMTILTSGWFVGTGLLHLVFTHTYTPCISCQ